MNANELTDECSAGSDTLDRQAPSAGESEQSAATHMLMEEDGSQPNPARKIPHGLRTRPASPSSDKPFVPAAVKESVGGRRVRAFIKMRPEDFQVEECPQKGFCLTATMRSDFTDDFLQNLKGKGKPGLVGATIVKYKRTQYDVVDDCAAKLGIPKHWVTFAGMKDGQSISASRIVFQNVHIDDVLALSGRKHEHGDGWWSLKDVTEAVETLENGMLYSNRFTLRVLVPGLHKQEILSYVNEKLGRLRSLGQEFGRDFSQESDGEQLIIIPNAFGGQRDGRRCNLKEIGETFWRQGAWPAIRRFICENSGKECQLARRLREEIAEVWSWLDHSQKCAQPADPRQYFAEMLKILEQPHPIERDAKGKPKPSYEVLSLTVEHEILKKLAAGMPVTQVMQSMHKKFSLWIGAYQGYWFNQVLSRLLRKEICLRNGASSIPLLACTPEAIRFYQRHCPEALPLKEGKMARAGGGLDPNDIEVDETVKQMFLVPRRKCGRDGRERENSPWRKAFIPVMGLKHGAEDGVWLAQFELRSGAYATVLLECLFDIGENFRYYDRNRGSRRQGR